MLDLMVWRISRAQDSVMLLKSIVCCAQQLQELRKKVSHVQLLKKNHMSCEGDKEKENEAQFTPNREERTMRSKFSISWNFWKKQKNYNPRWNGKHEEFNEVKTTEKYKNINRKHTTYFMNFSTIWTFARRTRHFDFLYGTNEFS